jgi:DNA modification methylase
VWDKNRPDGATFSECERAWTNGKGIAIKKYKCTWDGFHREGESGARFHPTQKPVKLTQDILSDFGGDIVIDPYCGSGTTLIACENLKRRCFGIEISPDYVAVCLQRFEDAFGIKGVLVQDDELQRPLVHGKGGKG